LALWLTRWPIQRRIAERRELSGRPIVLVAQPPRGGQQVALCSAAAGRLGVRVGMPVAEVTAILPPSAGVHFQDHDPAADRAALVALALWCEQFSPLVGLDPGAEPEALLLDVTGLGPLFGSSLLGGEERLARQVLHKLTERNLAGRAAVADTPSGAWALARFATAGRTGTPARPEQSISPLDGQKCPSYFPARIHPPLVIPPGKTPVALSPLPVEALRLPNEIIAWLRELGIERIEQLASLPRPALARRFGPELLLQLDRATGTASEVVRTCRPLERPLAAWSLEHGTTRTDQVEQILRQLLERLAARLAHQGLGATRLECRLRGPGRVAARLDIGLVRPSASVAHLWQLVRLQLERTRLAGQLTDFAVEALSTAPLECRQQELFDDARQTDRRQLALLVERLTSRLGPQAVWQPRRGGAALPERVLRLVPALQTPLGQGKATASRTAAKTDPPLTRPVRLLAVPQPLQVASVVPDGPPIQFACAGQTHRVTRYWGPERIETLWWRRPVRRDYYRVETPEGARYWLFRRLSDGRWFLHGMFE